MSDWVDLGTEIPGLNGNALHVLPARDEAALRQSLLRLGFEIHTIDGRHVTDRHSFLREVSRALGLPSWFGQNWDALDECLRELSTASGRVAILWRDAGVCLGRDLQTVLDAVIAFERAARLLAAGDDAPQQLEVILLDDAPAFGRHGC